jgi:hypothetical protein
MQVRPPEWAAELVQTHTGELGLAFRLEWDTRVMETMHGDCNYMLRRIRIFAVNDRETEDVLRTLLHEIAHARQFRLLGYSAHDTAFRRELAAVEHVEAARLTAHSSRGAKGCGVRGCRLSRTQRAKEREAKDAQKRTMRQSGLYARQRVQFHHTDADRYSRPITGRVKRVNRKTVTIVPDPGQVRDGVYFRVSPQLVEVL